MYVVQVLPNKMDTNAINAFLSDRVRQCIRRSEIEFPPPPGISLSSTDWLPLIRLRVDTTGYGPVNPHQFGHEFVGSVANPDEIIHV